MQAAAEGSKALMRTLSDSSSSRNRTSSLGSHTDTQSSSLSSPEVERRVAMDAGNNDAAAPAWTGPRSGSAPPERRNRMATLTSESMPAAAQVDGELSTSSEDRPVSPQSAATEAQHDRVQVDHHQIDKLLLDGLNVAKDRLLLLRADLEMEKLFNDPARTRLRVAPPGFPPNLNSYQRLLIHRLADMWSITRELEPASSSASPLTSVPAANVGSMISGTIVLVKTDNTIAPPVRIAALAPASDEEGSTNSNMMSLVSKTSELALDNTASTSDSVRKPVGIRMPQASKADSTAAIANLDDSITSTASQTPLSATSSSSTSASPAPVNGPVRIMSRAANAAARAALNKSRSPSAGSSTQGMTFEEREAAYQQARMRIFNEAHKPVASPVEQRSSPTSLPPPQVYQHRDPQPLHQPSQQQLHFSSSQQMHSPQFAQQIQQPNMSHMGMTPQTNPSLRPSAPVFVYQSATSPPGYHGGPENQQPQQLAYYPVQMHPGSNLHAGPPIQITMPSPAPLHAQQPSPQVAYAAYPMQMPNNGYMPETVPCSRPESLRSHSSQSSISTATSTSSIRTASTSSAQRSNLGTRPGYSSPSANLQPMRQIPSVSTRQGRPTPRASAGSSSTHSNASARSRHSQSSSSSPSVAGDSSVSVHVASSHTSTSDSGSSDRETGSKVKGSSEDSTLPGPHPTLPTRPDWIDGTVKSQTASSSASSVSSASSKEHASDLTEDHLSIQRDDAHTPLSSTSGKLTGRGLEDMTLNFDSVSDLASVVEDDQPDARSTPLPYSAPLPSDDTSVDGSARSGPSDRFETASQASSSRSTRNRHMGQAANVIENPPLRYDKVKGWTMLSSSNLSQSQLNRSPALSTTSANSLAPGGQYRKPPSPAPSVASSSSWSQHAFQPTHYTPTHHHAHQVPHSQEGYVPQQQQPQHPMQQFIMMPVPLPMAQNHNGQHHVYNGPPQQQHFSQPGFAGHPQLQQNIQQGAPKAVMVPFSPQPTLQSMQGPYQPQGPEVAAHYAGQPVQVFYQPMQQIQSGVQHQPTQQGYGQFVTQPVHARGMTPAEIMANGEMLYSYDLPRPVPRSGATLFDPNASN